MSDRGQRLKQRTIVGGAIALATGALLFLASGPGGPWFVLGVTAVLAHFCLQEVWTMGLIQDSTERFITRIGIVTPFVLLGCLQGRFLDPYATSNGDRYAALVVITLASGPLLAAAAMCLYSKFDKDHVYQVGSRRRVAASVAWVAGPLAGLVIVTEMLGAGALVALMVLSKLGDTAGYYVGSLLGVRHPFPKLSPGKTWAGCVASLISATVMGWIFAVTGLFPDPTIGALSGLLAGATVNVAAQAGDLLESWTKRRAGVKDSGTRFGPSGGFLDLVDSLLLSVPVALLLWPVLFAWPGI
jgi:CDP-diglyceride synthetase